MKFAKAAILLGCVYPQAFFAGAGNAGAAGEVIQEEGPQVTSISVRIESNRGNKSQTFLPSYYDLIPSKTRTNESVRSLERELCLDGRGRSLL